MVTSRGAWSWFSVIPWSVLFAGVPREIPWAGGGGDQEWPALGLLLRQPVRLAGGRLPELHTHSDGIVHRTVCLCAEDLCNGATAGQAAPFLVLAGALLYLQGVVGWTAWEGRGGVVQGRQVERELHYRLSWWKCSHRQPGTATATAYTEGRPHRACDEKTSLWTGKMTVGQESQRFAVQVLLHKGLWTSGPLPSSGLKGFRFAKPEAGTGNNPDGFDYKCQTGIRAHALLLPERALVEWFIGKCNLLRLT